MDSLEPLMTTDEVAAFLKVDVVTVRRLVARGELAAYRIGGEYRFARGDLMTFLGRQHLPARAPLPAAAELPEALPAREIERLAPRLSQRARRSLQLALEEAERAGYLGTEHLLLGLIREETSLAARVLDDLGIAQEAVRAALAEGDRWPEGPAGAPGGELLATELARFALQQALAQGAAWEHDHIGTEHLLYGLSKAADANSALLFELLGTTRDTVEAEVLRRVGR